ncbi:MAG TPA: hypothetical protein VIL39_09920 [Verrucomicrobiae bacterium]
MKKLLTLAFWALFVSASGIAEAGTLFSGPVIFVTPQVLGFGPVAGTTVVTNTLVVENMGKGTLIGTATVAAPFKILSGGAYSLRGSEAQIVTVIYVPAGATSDTQTVTFTGGGGAKATVTVKPIESAPKKSKQK